LFFSHDFFCSGLEEDQDSKDQELKDSDGKDLDGKDQGGREQGRKMYKPTYIKPLVLDESTVSQYTIYDVVYPLPGFDVIYPNNEGRQTIDDMIK
jgi:tRNA pseudouridine13 synthase